LTITVNGAKDGDPVILGIPVADIYASTVYFSYVSAPNTVTVEFVNNSAGNINPPSGTFTVTVFVY